MKPRVLVASTYYHPVLGGVETHARQLAVHLRRAGFGVEVLTKRWHRRPNRSVRVHESSLISDDDITVLHGIPITTRERTIVDLAPAHRQAISAFVGRRAAILKEALEPLTPPERAGLVKGLRAIVSGLDATLSPDDARK